MAPAVTNIHTQDALMVMQGLGVIIVILIGYVIWAALRQKKLLNQGQSLLLIALVASLAIVTITQYAISLHDYLRNERPAIQELIKNSSSGL